MRAILVRHGETAWNREGRFQGQDEVRLSRRGFSQARRVAKFLTTLRPVALYSSPLARTMDTAYELSHHLGLAVVPVEGLKELHLGELEGINGQQMQDRYPDIQAMWTRSPEKVDFPAGESLPQLQKRAWEAIEDLEQAHPNDVIAVVSHSFAICTIIFRLLNLPLSRFHMLNLDLGSISIMELKNGTRRLISLNEHLHQLQHQT